MEDGATGAEGLTRGKCRVVAESLFRRLPWPGYPVRRSRRSGSSRVAERVGARYAASMKLVDNDMQMRCARVLRLLGGCGRVSELCVSETERVLQTLGQTVELCVQVRQSGRLGWIWRKITVGAAVRLCVPERSSQRRRRISGWKDTALHTSCDVTMTGLAKEWCRCELSVLPFEDLRLGSIPLLRQQEMLSLTMRGNGG